MFIRWFLAILLLVSPAAETVASCQAFPSSPNVMARRTAAAEAVSLEAFSLRPVAFAIRTSRLALYHALRVALLLAVATVPQAAQSAEASATLFPHLNFPASPEKVLTNGPVDRLIAETQQEWTAFQRQHIQFHRRFVWVGTPMPELSFGLNPHGENAREIDDVLIKMVAVASDDLRRRGLQLNVKPEDVQAYAGNPRVGATRIWAATQFLPQYFALYNLYFELERTRRSADLYLHNIAIRPVREHHPVHFHYASVGDVTYEEIYLGPSLIPSWNNLVGGDMVTNVEETPNQDQVLVNNSTTQAGFLPAMVMERFSRYPGLWKGELLPDDAPGTPLEHLGYALIGQALRDARHGATTPLPFAELSRLINQLKFESSRRHEGAHIAQHQGRLGPFPMPPLTYSEVQGMAEEGTDPRLASFVAGSYIVVLTSPLFNRTNYDTDPHGIALVFLTNHLFTVLYNRTMGTAPIPAFADLPQTAQRQFLHRAAPWSGDQWAAGYETIVQELRTTPNAYTQKADLDFPDLPEPPAPGYSMRFYIALIGGLASLSAFLYSPIYIRRWRARKALERRAA